MSTSVLPDKVVHEAIDERQHIRTRIPAKAQLFGSKGEPIACDVQDISLGGLGLHCAEPLEVGGLYDVAINVGLSRVDLNFKAKIKVLSQKDGIVGTQFVDLDPKKADILRYIISSYMSGEIADINGLFNVMQRENYIKERKQKYQLERTFGQRLRAGLGTLIFLGLGVLALLYVLFKAYTLFFRMPAAQASVTTSAYAINMPDNGNVTYLVPEGQTEVSLGQPVASISTQLSTRLSSPADIAAMMDLAPDDVEALLGRANIETVISSPCDCTVYYSGARLDGFGYKGEPLMQLLPKDQPMTVTASVPYEQLDKLFRTRKVSLQVYGTDTTVDGRIISASVNQDQMVVLKIEPETALSLADYQKPVWVQFHLGLPGMPALDAIEELR
ncbi:PilZ domain-containing protein [Pseudomonas sp. 5Ae-yellow]|uniref:PilZ domain-containing protein n=1 Tax=Pseudomonas sp. 5Ae-yellow TaxID=2759848 RepID=UPI0015F6D27D|nr:PilZ domain-containing protein [Pseudomonas sp. 5Ae-yellow]MBA6420226.1 PilZ domain-containing protein [Pseudomonas sp. 5Ae-yellow]